LAKARAVMPPLKSGHSFGRKWLAIAADLYSGASVLQGSLRKINAHEQGELPLLGYRRACEPSHANVAKAGPANSAESDRAR
jgi:hypothetical protein